MNVFRLNTPLGLLQFPLKINSAIFCSGGIDSSILLYILLYAGVQPKILFFENAHSNKNALQNVLNFIQKELKLDFELGIETLVRDIDSSHDLKSDAIKNSNKADFIYSGATKNPTYDDLGSNPTLLFPNRPTPELVKKTNFILPFIDLDKRFTVQLYKQLGIEKMLLLTHTCTEQTVSECGLCFACAEKQWALTENEFRI